MFQKYVLLAVFQFFVLFLWAMPLLVGFLAGLFLRDKTPRYTLHVACGLILLINILVMIDKSGVPFFTGHLLSMFLPAPLPLFWQLVVGLLGDLLLFLVFRRFIAKGAVTGRHLISRLLPAGK